MSIVYDPVCSGVNSNCPLAISTASPLIYAVTVTLPLSSSAIIVTTAVSPSDIWLVSPVMLSVGIVLSAAAVTVIVPLAVRLFPAASYTEITTS